MAATNEELISMLSVSSDIFGSREVNMIGGEIVIDVGNKLENIKEEDLTLLIDSGWKVLFDDGKIKLDVAAWKVPF